jgi:hypothetical protein
MTDTWRPLAVDPNKHPIHGSVRKIESITNTSVGASAFVAVTVPAGKYTKSIVASMRAPGATFLVAASASGSTYYTISGTFELDICAKPGDTLFYVKTAASSAGVLEVMFLG